MDNGFNGCGDLREVQLQLSARRDFAIDYNERFISIGREIWSCGSSTMIKHFRRVATRYDKLAANNSPLELGIEHWAAVVHAGHPTP